MDHEILRKIKETVIDILKKSNMVDATEHKVRAEAEKRLGMDLSVSRFKQVVSQVIEGYLISCKGKEGEPGPSVRYKNTAAKRAIISKECNDDGDRVICQPSNDRSVKVHKLEGRTLVPNRQYYEIDGKQLPSIKGGISLTTDEWSALRDSIPAIEEVILQMRRKNKRSEHDANKLDAVSTPSTGVTPKFSIRTIRFNGENYHAWATQMKSLLQYLKIAHVLSDHCPNAVLGLESSSRNAARSKAAEQEWTSDGHACRHIILNSLSDSFFQQYTERTMSARELWKELNILFQYRTKRSQVKKYVEFRMVEEKPISEQVEELDNIAKSIVSAGMPIDQEFHYSVIISKLPPSWRDVKLMHEEHLPSVALIDRLRVEEQLRTLQNSHIAGASRNQGGQRTVANHTSKMVPHTSKMRQPKSQSLPSRKRERPMDVVKTVHCNDCGKAGHIFLHCPTSKYGKSIMK